MGMTAFEIFGVLKLETDQYNKDLSAAVRSGTVAGNLISDGIRIGAQTMVKAGQAAIQFGQDAISASTSYESAFTGVRKTVDATEEEYAQLSNWIMDASTKMASSKEDIAATMEIAGQLGIRGTEGLETFTETMIMLGDSTNLSSEEAASALAKFGNIAGVAAEDSSRIGSTIVDLGNHFATTEADIVNMSTRLASAGTIAGFSATDILALSTAMSSVGINAEAGGTAMSTIITKIGRAVDEGIDPANKSLQLFAQTAGMSAEEFAEAWKSSPTIALQGFVKGLDSMIDSGGNVTAVLDDLKIKGIREANTIRSLALASDVLTGAVDMANTAFEKNTALSEEATKRYQTTESQAMQTAEAFKNLKVAIGQELMPVYGELMAFSSTAMQEMTKGFQEGGITGLMESLGKALSEGLNAVSKKLPDFIDAGMNLLSALGQGIMDNLDTILAASQQIISSLIKGFGKALPNIINGAVQILMMLVNAIAENANLIADAAVQAIIALANGLTQALPELIPACVEIIVAIAEALLNNIGPLIEAAIPLVVAFNDAIIAAAPQLMASGSELIKALINGITGSFGALDELGPQTVSRFIDAIQTFIPNLIPPGMDFIINLIQGAINAFQNLFDLGKDTVDKFGEGIEEEVTGKAEGWGSHLIEAFIRGIELKHPILSRAVTGVAGIVAGQLHHTHPDYGPLADDYKWMPDMIDSFAQGINDNAYKLDEAINDAVDFNRPTLEFAGGYGMIKSNDVIQSNNYDSDYDDIVTAISDALMSMQLVVNIGNRPIEAMITSAQQATNHRSGGR